MSNIATALVTVTVDIVVSRFIAPVPDILLIQRGKAPYQGMWALPGGKLAATDASLEDAARRELWEETGLTVDGLTQTGAYGDRDRDPRGRFVSIAFVADTLFYEPDVIQAGDDAVNVQWFALNALPPLAFDHLTIIKDAVKNFRF